MSCQRARAGLPGPFGIKGPELSPGATDLITLPLHIGSGGVPGLTCWVVFSRPEATPASESGTPDMASVIIAGPRIRDEGLVPLPDSPVPYYPMQDERVAADELLGRLAGGEDAHRAVLKRVGEGPDHEQLTAVGELAPASPVRACVQGRLLRQVVGRLVEHHCLHACPPVVARARVNVTAACATASSGAPGA